MTSKKTNLVGGNGHQAFTKKDLPNQPHLPNQPDLQNQPDTHYTKCCTPIFHIAIRHDNDIHIYTYVYTYKYIYYLCYWT